MRILVLGVASIGLAACQTTTQSSVPRPVAAPLETAGAPLGEQELRGVISPRRLKINACLAEQGLAPLPVTLGGINAPMDRTQADLFQTCMGRST
ncbi:MAG: hypothetical protein ACI9KS_002672 [Sulfitobacter sp.]|jgi:hypothetical protein